MKILCTDLEGTLAPEIWQEIANEYQIEDLQLTTCLLYTSDAADE